MPKRIKHGFGDTSQWWNTPTAGVLSGIIRGRFIGRILKKGHCTIGCNAGHGGMATVYLTDDLKHSRKVALKLMRPFTGKIKKVTFHESPKLPTPDFHFGNRG